MSKNIKKPKMIEYLEMVAPLIPFPIYWGDVDTLRVTGANEACLKAMGAQTPEDVIGKTPYDYYPKEIADNIIAHAKAVIDSGIALSQEDIIKDITTGKTRYYSAIRAPLFDEGKIVAIIGTSIEITAEKEAELLKIEKERLEVENQLHKLENQANKTIIEEQEKFKKIVGQMVHDIQSPLSSLQTIIQSTINIPENERITLRAAAISMADITHHMLNNYKNEANDLEEQRQPVLVSASLLQILSQKRYQYKNLFVVFEHNFNDETHFAFIKIEPICFKRMISNIINNAVDALENRPGKVEIRLRANSEWVIISIEDDGKGMPDELAEKIMNGVAVTDGKKHGHGIGLTQVRETILSNYGKFTIYSEEGHGTSVILKFPKIDTPNWIVEEIKINTTDHIVILDDDESIHGAWNARFKTILESYPNVKIQHFSVGKEAINFINSLSSRQKSKIYLLTDYELLKQDLNGVDVILRTKIKRSILVTSHYANVGVRELAANAKVKILPKELAFAVSIKTNKKIKLNSKKVDMVWIDDDKTFVNGLVSKYYKHLNVDIYNDPISFLEDVVQYPIDTKIILDNHYYNYDIKCDLNGCMIAKQLHDKGYTKLYLLSGEGLKCIPDYLTLILKSDIDKIKFLDQL